MACKKGPDPGRTDRPKGARTLPPAASEASSNAADKSAHSPFPSRARGSSGRSQGRAEPYPFWLRMSIREVGHDPVSKRINARRSGHRPESAGEHPFPERMFPCQAGSTPEASGQHPPSKRIFPHTFEQVPGLNARHPFLKRINPPPPKRAPGRLTMYPF